MRRLTSTHASSEAATSLDAPAPRWPDRTRAPIRPRGASATAGFTLLELALVLALIGLLVTLVVPRLGVLTSVELESSARRMATRIRFLREEAARRGTWVRLVFDPVENAYQPELLVQTTTGPQFVRDDGPLFRAVRLPQSLGLELHGPGVVPTPQGLPAAIFYPDGFAEPVVIYIDDGRGRVFTLVVGPLLPRPEVFDRHVSLQEMGFL